VKLSDAAKAIESACKEGNVEFVRKQHEACMADYKIILDKISEHLAAGDAS
jgi:hypothetical protein